MSGTIPQKCPACGEDMHVCLLRCPSCRTEVQGDFMLGRFSRLSEDQLFFLETFLRYRGNLKDVGAALSISYPTARNRLDQLIEALDFEEKAGAKARRLDILEKLKTGEISTEEALDKLQNKEYK